MDFTVEILAADHGRDWKALRLEGARDFPLGFLISADEAANMTDERARNILDFGTMRGVFDRERLVGFCGYRRENFERTRHRAEIGPFFVTAEYHGTGAARHLMSAIVQEAQGDGVEQLELFVDVENHRAIRFYEKFGFQRIATHYDGVRIDGVSRDDYFYCLRLEKNAI